ASVSAVQRGAAFPEPEEEFDETILAFRRRTTWTLTRPLGVPIKVAGDVLIIGRRPAADPDFPDAQLVPVADETRTMSKTHARLELHGGSWLVVDLDSTNGVILVREDGSEIEATPGVPERLVERFFLGDAELTLAQDSLGS
ncbi:MAG TPA: FHA domain-containing protein, partial [Microbacterium sp.]|nr:FHA domain-containing protein [Microbacterium sp.]